MRNLILVLAVIGLIACEDHEVRTITLQVECTGCTVAVSDDKGDLTYISGVTGKWELSRPMISETNVTLQGYFPLIGVPVRSDGITVRIIGDGEIIAEKAEEGFTANPMVWVRL